jgi:ELWxxDGT repeat protein
MGRASRVPALINVLGVALIAALCLLTAGTGVAYAVPDQIKDINPGSGNSSPSSLADVDGTLYFSASDGTNGSELWKSDATTAGTIQVKDIWPGSIPSGPSNLTKFGGTLYFTANDGTFGGELWKSDGTTVGTALVKDINPGSDSSSAPSSATVVGGTLYFRADNGTNGTELWKSDGSAAGTTMVKDINPGAGNSNLFNLTAVGGTVYFFADDGTNGRELWKSDGTDAGTTLVKDIRPGSTSSGPLSLTNSGGTLYFSASDGTNGTELWKSDGTTAGTTLVKDIWPGVVSSGPNYLTSVSGILYFSALVAGTGGIGVELWKSDGTAAGTTLVKDINPGAGSSSPAFLTEVGGTLYFSALDTSINGIELWKSDGTTDGTTLVKNINPTDFASSSPTDLTNVGGTLYFSANNGTNGIEVWKSDGTTAGTILTRDINPGSGNSSPNGHNLTDVGGALYFRADDGTSGSELWRDIGAPDTQIDTGPTGTIAVDQASFTFAGNPGADTAKIQCRIDEQPFADCTSPIDFTGLTDGSHTASFRAEDAAGNQDFTPATRNFTVDTTAPDTTIDTGPSGTIAVDQATFTFGGDPAGDTAKVQCQIDSDAFADCTSPRTFTGLAEGLHTATFRAEDAVGNQDPTPATLSFTVDTIPPETTIDAGPVGATGDSTPTFEFSSSEPGSSFECRIDSDSFASCSSPETVAALTDYLHTFEVKSTDAAGNQDPTPDIRSFTVDTVAPDTPIATGPSGTIAVDQASFAFAGHPAGDTAKVQCRIDDQPFADCTSPRVFTGLADGPHTATFRAEDAAGNQDPNPDTRSFTVDTIPPDTTIETGPSGTIPVDQATFTFAGLPAGDTSNFQCRIDDQPFADCLGGRTFSGLADGPHTAEFRAEDAAGNQDPTPATRSFAVDTTVYRAKIGQVSVRGTARVKQNRNAVYRVSIRNTGNAAVTGVRLKVTGRGIRLNLPVGSIGAGRTRTVRVNARIRSVGRIVATFRVSSSNAGSKAVRKRILVRR